MRWRAGSPPASPACRWPGGQRCAVDSDADGGTRRDEDRVVSGAGASACSRREPRRRRASGRGGPWPGRPSSGAPRFGRDLHVWTPLAARRRRTGRDPARHRSAVVIAARPPGGRRTSTRPRRRSRRCTAAAAASGVQARSNAAPEAPAQRGAAGQGSLCTGLGDPGAVRSDRGARARVRARTCAVGGFRARTCRVAHSLEAIEPAAGVVGGPDVAAARVRRRRQPGEAEPEGLPADGRQQRVPADVALALLSGAVPGGAVHLDRQLDVVVRGVEQERLAAT